MYCKYCGKQIDDDSIFCRFCGKEQLIVPNSNKSEQNEINKNLNFIGSNPKTKVTKRKESKYDQTYKKETGATFAGVVLLFINLIIYLVKPEYSSMIYVILIILSLIIRIIITVWVGNIAKRQNRNSFGWSLFGFFLPVLALIIIGLLKKLNRLFHKKQIQNEQSPTFKIEKDKYGRRIIK